MSNSVKGLTTVQENELQYLIDLENETCFDNMDYNSVSVEALVAYAVVCSCKEDVQDILNKL